MIPVAAMSNAAYTFSVLGYVTGPGKHIFFKYGTGGAVSESELIGDALYAVGIVGALTIFGFATFWLILALIAFVRDFRKTEFNMNMWSSIYPWGTYALVLSQLASDFNSPAFRVICSIFVIIAVLYWMWLIVKTIPNIISGEALKAEMKKRDEEKQQHGQTRAADVESNSQSSSE